MKGKCKFLDYETNTCYLHHKLGISDQCIGKEICEDYEESED